MNMHSPIIGVTGKAGAGKDTVCNMATDILHQHGIASRRIAVAAPLKEVCTKLFGEAFDLDPCVFWGTQDEKNAVLDAIPGYSGRKILQHIGTEGFRHIQPQVWSKLMYARATHLLQAQQLAAVFISDVRMLSEAKLIQDNGGIIVRVLRPSDDADGNQGLQGHSTELELTTIQEDFVINNEGRSLRELKVLVRNLLIELHLL